MARDPGVRLATVRRRLVALAGKREIVMCDVTRFEDGKRIDAWRCRVSGYVPAPSPRPKAGTEEVARHLLVTGSGIRAISIRWL